MSDRSQQIFDCFVGSWARCRVAAMLGLWVLAGCDRRSEVASEAYPVADSESSMSVASPAEPMEPANDVNFSGDAVNPEPTNPEPTNPRSNEDPVMAYLSISSETLIAGESIEVTVTLRIDSGFEVRSLSALPPKIPTLLELQLPTGFTAVEDWRASAPVRSFNPGGESVYVGEANFKRRIHVAADAKPGDYLLACSVSYQACNSRQCLRPTKTQLSVAVSVSR